MNRPSPYRTVPALPGQLMYAGVSASLIGKVSDSLPHGLALPNSTSAIAAPPACPIIQPSSTAATLSIHELIATGAPLLRTTTLLGCAFDTALISACCCLVRSRSARSYPSDSFDLGSAIYRTAASA